MSLRNTKPEGTLCPACHENPARLTTCQNCGAMNTIPCRNCQQYPVNCKECGEELTDFKVKPTDEFEGPKLQNVPGNTSEKRFDNKWRSD